MINTIKIITNKIYLTLTKLKKTAYHHFGDSPTSIIKLLYYSGLRINTFIVYENDLYRELPDHNLSHAFRVATPSIMELDELRGKFDVPREFYCDEVYKYQTCYIAFDGDEPAYLQWVLFKDDYYRFLILPDDVVGFEYLVTLPKYRGKSLCAKMLAYTSLEYKSKGFRKAVSVVHESNYPAIKAFESVGYKRIAQIKSIGPFNRKFKIT